MADAEARIHPSAVVDPGAHIGHGVSIGAFSIIGPDVSIADGTQVGPHCSIAGPTTIGRDNRIHRLRGRSVAIRRTRNSPVNGPTS